MFTISGKNTEVRVDIIDNALTLLSLKNKATGKEWAWVKTVFEFPNYVAEKPVSWEYKGITEENGTVLSFNSGSKNLTLKSIWIDDGFAIKHYMTIENPNSEDVTLSYAPTFSITMDGNDLELLTVERGGPEPGAVGICVDKLSENDNIIINDAKIPIAFLSDGDERLLVAHTFGTGEMYVEKTEEGIRLESGLGRNFKTDVPSGESLYIPASFIATGKGTQDEFTNLLSKYLYEKNCPDVIKNEKWPHVMFNIWNSVGGADPHGDHFFEVCDKSKDLGIDRVVLDYGWWDKLGEWDPSPSKWAGGMTKYGKYAKEMGLEFVMYFLFHNGLSEKEGALSYTTHPDWFIENGAVDEICDLGNKECADYIKETLARKLNEFEIPGYRSDFSPVALSSSKVNRHKYGVDTAYWNYIGFFEILSYLQENVPNFTYENCCGGGYYKDFATMKYTSNIFATDTYKVIDARKSFYDTSFVYPPCQIAPQISFFDADKRIWDSFELRKKMTLGYIYRSVMLGAMYVNLDFPVYNMDKEEYEFLKKQIDIYKKWIRPLVVNGELYHVTPRPDNINWDGIEYFDDKAGKGVVFAFRPDNDIPCYKIKLQGLKNEDTYSLRFEDGGKSFDMTGRELMEKGITFEAERIYWSEIVYIEKSN